MTPVPLFAALALSLPAAPNYVLNVGAGTEVRLREPGERLADGSEDDRAFDAELNARLELGLEFSRARLALSYEPQLTFTNFTKDDAVALLHTAGVGSSLRFKRADVALAQRFSFGTRAFTSLTGASGAPLTDGGAQGASAGGGTTAPAGGGTTGAPGTQPGTTGSQTSLLPGATVASYYSSETFGSISYRLTRRSALSLSLLYLAAGGADEEAQNSLPFAFGPTLGLQYRYLLTRVDALVTSAQAEQRSTNSARSTTSSERLPDTTSELASLVETWQRRWSANTDTEVGAGVAFVPGLSDDTTFTVHPVARAAIYHSEVMGPDLNKSRPKLTLRAVLETTAQIEQLTGRADRRLIIGGGFAWARRDLTIQGFVDHQRSIGDSDTTGNSMILTNADAGLRYQLFDELYIGAGYRAQYQTIDAPTTVAASSALDGWRTVAYVNLGLALDPIDL